MKEKISDIGMAIQKHFVDEENIGRPMPLAIARYKAKIQGTDISQIYLTNQGCDFFLTFPDNSTNVAKNTLLGGHLIKDGIGKWTYCPPKGLLEVEVENKATFKRTGYRDAEEVEVWLEAKKSYRYASIYSLTIQNREREEELKTEKEILRILAEKKEIIRHAKEQAEAEARRLAAEQKRQKDEEKRREQEEFARKAAEEAARLAEEQRRKEEEELQRQAVADELERKIAEGKEKIEHIKSFVRKEVSLRSQHILDESQEEAKRSHIYDDVPILIDGGPGTGKTTTTIQRLKFLLDIDALKDYCPYMRKVDIEELTDPAKVNQNWIFFSPNSHLLQYLRANMQQEGLNANDGNTFTIGQFRKKMLLEYKLRNPDTDGPFKVYQSTKKDVKKLILRPKETVKDFERFCINNICGILDAASRLETSKHEWHRAAITIKSICQKASTISDMYNLMNLLFFLQSEGSTHVREWEEQLNNMLKSSSVYIQQKIKSTPDLLSQVDTLFAKWKKERIPTSEDVLENEMEEEEEQEETTKVDFDVMLYKQIRSLLKSIGLKKVDTKKKLSKRQSELNALVEHLYNTEDIERIGSIAWFVKNYAAITKGIESNIFSQIPRLYKLFRKQQSESASVNYNQHLLKELISKENNKHLHADEIDLLIGFINNLLHRVYQRSNTKFQKLNHKYALAFKDWCRHVIGVDEATDYSLMDFYLIYSFRHYNLSSVTLSGDVMQGLTDNGILDWDDIKSFVMPKLCKYELKVSYRQLPTLVDVAREMYNDVQGHYPLYHSDKERDEDEPLPIAYISYEEEDKARWICQRVVDVWKVYNEQMPSVAIFVGDDTNIDEFVNTLNETDILNGIEIVNCSEGRTINRKDVVRVFRLSEVKGMEFEVVFFHNLDEALLGGDEDLMTRYVYVGISRATTHLAATFCDEELAGNTLRFFHENTDSWSM